MFYSPRVGQGEPFHREDPACFLDLPKVVSSRISCPILAELCVSACSRRWLDSNDFRFKMSYIHPFLVTCSEYSMNQSGQPQPI